MYTPQAFALTERAELHALMERFGFATLITVRDGVPQATQLPLRLDPDAGEHGTLIGHLARANEQWHDLASGRDALVIFAAEHAYISPSWYKPGPSVPTWNYSAVHAYGTPRIIEDAGRVEAILRELTAYHEGRFAAPWPMDLEPEYLWRQMRALVAFEIPIARLEGKAKLSQNRPTVDRRNVVAALAASDDPGERGVAKAMRTALDGAER